MNHHLRQRPRSRRLLASLAASALLLTACASADASDEGGAVAVVSGPASTSDYRGTSLPEAVTMDDAIAVQPFASSAGGQTTLGDLQQARLMLLYFGYTHCPDVCPTTLATVAIALRQLPDAVQRRTQVVMVTADPERDTPEVLADYLGRFDGDLSTSFLGLTGPLEQVHALGDALGVEMSAPEVLPDGVVIVDHGAQVLGFVAGEADLLWLAGTSSADYAHDIQALVEQIPPP